MTCAPKEYEIKTKITWKFLFSGSGGLTFDGGGGDKNLVVGGRDFSRWEWRGGWANFWPVGGGLQHFPSRENPGFTCDFLQNFTLELQSGLFCYIIQCKHYIKTRYAPTVIPISNVTWYPFKMAKDSWKSCILSKLVRQVLKVSFSEIGTGS